MEQQEFEDRMFMASQAVYAQIERGELTMPVEAALMEAQLRASTDECDPR